MDLAKLQDYTSICVFDRTTNNMVFIDRWKDLEWPFQVQKIKAIVQKYNNCPIVLDSTGIGDVVQDALNRESVGVISYKFTEQSKKQLIEKLSIAIDNRMISILPVEELINELESYSYTIGPTGRIRYNAPQGQHDDLVIATALGCWDLYPHSKEKPKKPLSLIARYRARLAEKWLVDDSLPEFDEEYQEYEKQWEET